MAALSFRRCLVALTTILLCSFLAGAYVTPIQHLPGALQKRVLDPPLPDIEKVKKQIIKPRRDECTFWSDTTELAAKAWAGANGKKMMGDFDAVAKTTGSSGYIGFEGEEFDERAARCFDDQPTWTAAETKEAMGIVSRAYAELCSGEATVVLDKDYSWDGLSIWERFELPALKANPDITDIFVQWVDKSGKPIGGPVRLDR